MDNLNNIFIETTDPLANYNRLISLDVMVSIMFHTVLYLLVLKISIGIFKIRLSYNIYYNLFFVLLSLMTFGYFARLYRAKSLYKTLLVKGYDESTSYNISLDLIHNGYFTFYFLG